MCLERSHPALSLVEERCCQGMLSSRKKMANGYLDSTFKDLVASFGVLRTKKYNFGQMSTSGFPGPSK
jgi:hypothetical protein